MLAVFFLPFHFHFITSVAEVSNEWSCYLEGRTHVALLPTTADWSPIFQPSFVVVCEPQVFGWLSIKSPIIRAPPLIFSL